MTCNFYVPKHSHVTQYQNVYFSSSLTASLYFIKYQMHIHISHKQQYHLAENCSNVFIKYKTIVFRHPNPYILVSDQSSHYFLVSTKKLRSSYIVLLSQNSATQICINVNSH
jgi:hypothetical protein